MGKVAKTPAPIERNHSASEAFAIILAHNYAQLQEWEPYASNYDNIEGVHQTRVAMRRMRSALSVFKSAIPKTLTRTWGDELRFLAGEMGDARDLDVLIDEGLDAMRDKMPLGGGEKLEQKIRHHRELAYVKVNAMLQSERYAHFKQAFPAWFSQHAWEDASLSEKKIGKQQMKVLPFSRLVVNKQLAKVLKAGENIDRNDSVRMHQLRIECKKLRYGVEFFIPIRKTFAKILPPLKRLQDILGVMNDVTVMEGHLQTILADVDDHEVLEYAGGIVGWRSCEYHNNLSQFETLWKKLQTASKGL